MKPSVALLALLAAVGCTGNGAGHSQPQSAVSNRPSAIEAAVLGSTRFFPNHYDRGFGTAHPAVVFNGGDPSGWVRHLRWTNWGRPTATAVGQGWNYRPMGGYYKRNVLVHLRATGLGPCDGKIGYRWLYVAKAKRPGSQVVIPLGRWWGKQSLCEVGGGKKAP